MKLPRQPLRGRARTRGVTTLVVLVFLLLMLTFIAGNAAALRALKRELVRVEQRQLQRYPAASGTNRVAAATPAPVPRRAR
jgi:hypothetical protein